MTVEVNIEHCNFLLSKSNIEKNTMKNVHEFDGHVKKFEIKTRYTISEKKVIFNDLIKQIYQVSAKIKKSVYQTGMKGLICVITDTQTDKNFSDNMYADDILAEIGINMMKLTENDKIIDMCFNILEQMGDMLNLGRCPSGRVIRLMQIWHALSDISDKKK